MPKPDVITLLDEYQAEARKTLKPDLVENPTETLKYLCMKLAEEAGEVIAPIAKHLYHGKALDKDNVAEECADALWYISNIAGTLGYSLSDIATKNIAKLRKRHGERYRAEHYTKKAD